MKNISCFKNSYEIQPVGDVSIEVFLNKVKEGAWQDAVLRYRTSKDKEEKKKLPAVTLSGIFSQRKETALQSHSGFIGIDIDNVEDINAIKSTLKQDPYVYASFVSCGGAGLCLIFKIDGKKHREAFAGIGKYLLDNYNIIVDPTSVNLSRLRFVSYDPDLYLCSFANKFEVYPTKEQGTEPKYASVIFVQSDFDAIVKQVQDRSINLCEDYYTWLRISFGLADYFGEGGREYFHIFSRQSSKYKEALTDKQYDSCLKSKNHRKNTIATVYHYCKEAGVKLYSKETQEIVRIAQIGKDSGLDAPTIKKNIEKFGGVAGEHVDSIIGQVEAGSKLAKEEDNIIDQLEVFLKTNYAFKRNVVTRYIELEGTPMEGKHFNSIFIKAKRVIPKLSFELVQKLIDSDYTQEYNPLQEWFAKHKEYTTTGSEIDRLAGSLCQADKDYTKNLLTKWLVGIVASVHGNHSPLMLCLTGGEQGTGKTHWFRNLLPEGLQNYYAESKLDEGKDSEILMTQKLLIIDDEMGGKSKADEKRLKELLSKQVFSLREPYGKGNVDLQRLAVLGGTSNDNEVLNDPTGNRRLIPFEITRINHDLYNSVDKTALFVEAYKLYHNKFKYELTKEEINLLASKTENHRKRSLELELIQKYYEPAKDENFCIYMTASEIKVEIEEMTKQKLSLDKLGKELAFAGFNKLVKRQNGALGRFYLLHKRSQ